MSYYRQQLEAWLADLDVMADTVYDIGGAQGNVKDRVKSWEVKNYRVLDIPIYDLNEPWQTTPEVDIIFCLEVFEYLINPMEAMENISGLLKPGGKAYITAPLVYPVHNEVELDSLRYTETGLTRLANNAGLTVANVWYRRDKSGLLTAFYAKDGMHPAKGIQHDITGYIMEIIK